MLVLSELCFCPVRLRTCGSKPVLRDTKTCFPKKKNQPKKKKRAARALGEETHFSGFNSPQLVLCNGGSARAV
ncbi:uncharacterized [Tachysurus ichikawai]